MIRKWDVEKLVNTTTLGVQTAPKVAGLTGGGYVIAWTDASLGANVDVRFQIYSASGAKVGPESVNVELDVQGEPQVTGLADGGFLVVFTDQNAGSATDVDVISARYDANGTFLSALNLGPSANTLNQPTVTSYGTGAIILWHDVGLNGGDIRMAVLNAANVQVGATSTVNVTTAGDQSFGDVAVLRNGTSVALAWVSGGEIFMRVGGGSPLVLSANESQISGSGTVAAGSGPKIAPLANGGFVVVWQAVDAGDSEEAGSSAIRGRVFTREGFPIQGGLVPEFLINTYTEGDQAAPEVVATEDGGFLVVWHSFDTGAQADIKAQLFDSRGEKVGREILINTASTGNQTIPSVAPLTDGRLVVTWADANPSAEDPSAGVRHQIIDPRDGYIEGDNNANVLYGHDLLSDEINGLAGNDLLFGLGGDDAIYGGDGADQAYGLNGADAIFGGAQADTLNGGAGNDVVLGEADADLLFGEGGDDNLLGGFANDTLNGGVGSDGLLGEDGADVLVGEAGNDALYGGAGNDTMFGGADDDTLVGDAGNDQILGDAGTDTAVGQAGDDQLFGGGGNDVLNGGADNDVIRGEDGDDVLVGEDGGDDLQGGIGNDTLFGDAGGDALLGGDGADVLIGGAGGDVLNGGAGADIFWFKTTLDGVDLIQDFTSGTDKIYLTSAAFNLPLGGLNPANFVAAATPIPNVGAPQILYNLTTGILSFDPDGTGPMGAVTLAQMFGPLSASDFLVVA